MRREHIGSLLGLAIIFVLATSAFAVQDIPTFSDEWIKNNQDKTLVVEFYKPACSFCIKMLPIIEAVEKEMKDMKFVKINGDNAEALRTKYNLTASPTFLIFKNGKQVGQFKGYMPKEQFVAKIKNPTIEKAQAQAQPVQLTDENKIKARIYDLIVIIGKAQIEVQALEKQLSVKK